jgi:hypothetical protein
MGICFSGLFLTETASTQARIEKPDLFPIKVQKPSSEIIKLEVIKSDTIGSIIAQIGLNGNHCLLSPEGRILNRDHCLSDCHVKENSMLKMDKLCSIKVEKPDKNIITLEVQESGQVGTILEQDTKLLGDYYLTLDGKKLRRELPLCSGEVKEACNEGRCLKMELRSIVMAKRAAREAFQMYTELSLPEGMGESDETEILRLFERGDRDEAADKFVDAGKNKLLSEVKDKMHECCAELGSLEGAQNHTSHGCRTEAEVNDVVVREFDDHHAHTMLSSPDASVQLASLVALTSLYSVLSCSRVGVYCQQTMAKMTQSVELYFSRQWNAYWGRYFSTWRFILRFFATAILDLSRNQRRLR